jgi:hypothetical protein
MKTSHKSDELKKLKKKGVHKSGTYVFNGLEEHTAILSHFLTFITGSSSRVSTIGVIPLKNSP